VAYNYANLIAAWNSATQPSAGVASAENDLIAAGGLS
jgi:hypothetical protein